MIVFVQVVVMLVTGLLGLAVVLNRDPLEQALVLGLFGYALVSLFLVLQAPDVALSAMVVGSAAYPLLILLTLAKVKTREKRK